MSLNRKLWITPITKLPPFTMGSYTIVITPFMHSLAKPSFLSFPLYFEDTEWSWITKIMTIAIYVGINKLYKVFEGDT